MDYEEDVILIHLPVNTIRAVHQNPDCRVKFQESLITSVTKIPFSLAVTFSFLCLHPIMFLQASPFVKMSSLPDSFVVSSPLSAQCIVMSCRFFTPTYSFAFYYDVLMKPKLRKKIKYQIYTD